MSDKIGFFYNLHVNFYSFVYCIATVKKHAPSSPIHLYTDSSFSMLEQYKKAAEELDLKLITRDKECTYINRNDGPEINKVKMREFLDRLYHCCINMPEVDWIVRLEDDVYMRKPVTELPNTDAGANGRYLGMGGASIIKRQSFITIYETLDSGWYDHQFTSNSERTWAGDGLIKEMITATGFTISEWKEISEPWYGDKDVAAFHHGDKFLYNKDYLKQRGL